MIAVNDYVRSSWKQKGVALPLGIGDGSTTDSLWITTKPVMKEDSAPLTWHDFIQGFLQVLSFD